MPSMPPWPCHRTAGTFSTCVFTPCWVTSQTGPTFSVMSIRPSGRKAMRQGSLKSATCVIVNGRSGSGFSSPALICARAVADVSVSSTAALRSVFMSLLRSRTFETIVHQFHHYTPARPRSACRRETHQDGAAELLHRVFDARAPDAAGNGLDSPSQQRREGAPQANRLHLHVHTAVAFGEPCERGSP